MFIKKQLLFSIFKYYLSIKFNIQSITAINRISIAEIYENYPADLILK